MTPDLSERVFSNGPCPSEFFPSVRLSLKDIRDYSLAFSEILHEVRVNKVKKSDNLGIKGD